MANGANAQDDNPAGPPPKGDDVIDAEFDDVKN